MQHDLWLPATDGTPQRVGDLLRFATGDAVDLLRTAAKLAAARIAAVEAGVQSLDRWTSIARVLPSEPRWVTAVDVQRAGLVLFGAEWDLGLGEDFERFELAQQSRKLEPLAEGLRALLDESAAGDGLDLVADFLRWDITRAGLRDIGVLDVLLASHYDSGSPVTPVIQHLAGSVDLLSPGEWEQTWLQALVRRPGSPVGFPQATAGVQQAALELSSLPSSPMVVGIQAPELPRAWELVAHWIWTDPSFGTGSQRAQLWSATTRFLGFSHLRPTPWDGASVTVAHVASVSQDSLQDAARRLSSPGAGVPARRLVLLGEGDEVGEALDVVGGSVPTRHVRLSQLPLLLQILRRLAQDSVHPRLSDALAAAFPLAKSGRRRWRFGPSIPVDASASTDEARHHWEMVLRAAEGARPRGTPHEVEGLELDDLRDLPRLWRTLQDSRGRSWTLHKSEATGE